MREGQPESELSRLKQLWRTLSEDARAFWRSRLQSSGVGNTQPEIRRDILAKLKINLRHNSQLSDFKNWMEDQDARDAQAERAEENQRRLTEQHPDWSIDRVREEVLKQSYLETLATGNFELGLKTVAANSKIEELQFDKEKFKESMKTKLQAGLDAVAEAFKGHAEAMQFYTRARSMIEREMK